MEMYYLIYVNYVGRNHEKNHIYEFIFCDHTNKIDGQDWDTMPASNRPEIPNELFIKRVGTLESQMKFDLVQGSDTFAVWDAIDGVIALAWENMDAYDTYPENRLAFQFGMTMDEVEGKLYEKDLILKYKKKNEKH